MIWKGSMKKLIAALVATVILAGCGGIQIHQVPNHPKLYLISGVGNNDPKNAIQEVCFPRGEIINHVWDGHLSPADVVIVECAAR